MKTSSFLAALVLTATSLSAQTAEPITPADLGPAKYDASGGLKCSADSNSYDQICGFRVLRKPGGAAEIWIANIAHNDKVVYRVLYFDHGEFTTRDDAKLDYSRESDNWLLNVDHSEFYQIPDAVILGG